MVSACQSDGTDGSRASEEIAPADQLRHAASQFQQAGSVATKAPEGIPRSIAPIERKNT
jgi:hypothetical protein